MGNREQVLRQGLPAQPEDPSTGPEPGLPKEPLSLADLAETLLQNDQLGLSNLGLHRLGLRTAGEREFITPDLNLVARNRDLRDYGVPAERSEFEHALNSPGMYEPRIGSTSPFEMYVAPDAISFNVNAPLQIDPVSGRFIVRLLDDRDHLPLGVSLHVTTQPLQAVAPGDEEFRYGSSENSLRFLFQRGQQAPEASPYAALGEAQQEFWRYGRVEDQHVILGLHDGEFAGGNFDVTADLSGSRLVVGGVLEYPDSALSFAHARSLGGDPPRDSFALGYFGPQGNFELNYVPGDQKRPLTGYIQPIAFGLGEMQVGPVVEVDPKSTRVENLFNGPLTGALLEHRNPNGQTSVRVLFDPDQKSFKVNAGIYYRY